MSDTDEINVCSLDDLKVAVKMWDSRKLCRILRVIDDEYHDRLGEVRERLRRMMDTEKAELDGLQAEIDADQAAKEKEDR